MRRIIGIIAGVIGCILTAGVIAVISGGSVFGIHVNVIGFPDNSVLKYILCKNSLKSLFIAVSAGILLIILSYFLLFKKKK